MDLLPLKFNYRQFVSEADINNGIAVVGRACVKTQIQKTKVGNQNHFTDFWSSLWGISISLSDIPCD